ncbi:WD repeat domain 37 [Carabus blaptoides fortunei]
MESNIMIAPNLNGKVYREFLPRQNSINVFLDFIEINNEQVILGSSNLNGRYWEGSLCYYQNSDVCASFNIEEITAVECFDFGITDGKFLLNNQKVIVSQDSGEVKLFDIENGELKLIKNNIEGHDDFITEISLWSDNKNFVTSSADASIKIWNIAESGTISCLHTFTNLHSNLISSVSVNIKDMNTFASCSYDKTAFLWDKRTNKPGAVSNSSGDVYLVDIREPKEFLSKETCFNRSVHKIKFSPNGLLAVCADDSKIAVLDTANDDLNMIYTDNRHEDFVRGLAWKDNILISCGWDKQVLVHNV